MIFRERSTYLQGNNLLASNRPAHVGLQCSYPVGLMMLVRVSFRCPDCHNCTTIRDGSFSSKSHLPFQKWAILMYGWALNYPVTDAAHEAEVTEATAYAVYQWLREVP